jgi:hypothetical protein
MPTTKVGLSERNTSDERSRRTHLLFSSPMTLKSLHLEIYQRMDLLFIMSVEKTL